MKFGELINRKYATVNLCLDLTGKARTYCKNTYFIRTAEYLVLSWNFGQACISPQRSHLGSTEWIKE